MADVPSHVSQSNCPVPDDPLCALLLFQDLPAEREEQAPGSEVRYHLWMQIQRSLRDRFFPAERAFHQIPVSLVPNRLNYHGNALGRVVWIHPETTGGLLDCPQDECTLQNPLDSPQKSNLK